MKQSESITELAAAMALAQGEMGGAIKDSSNPFFKSKYADLASVVKAIKEPFSNHGLSYVQMPIANEAGVGVATRLMHNSGEFLESEYVLPLTKNDPQAAGSAITYARRYALQSMAGIPSSDDDAESAMLRVVEDDITEITGQLMAAESLDDLQSTFKMAWHSFPKSRPALTAAKDTRKRELSDD